MTQKLIAYKRMPIWTKDTMPEALQRKHNTKVGTWGKITVLKGQLRFIELTEEGEEIASHLFEAGAENPMAEPQAWHRVEAATDDVEWYLEFYCEPKDYFPKKYNTNPVHSEVLEAVGIVPAEKALDLGCGQGRNALFLAQHGFDVTAVDQNELALEILQSIVAEEDLEMPVGLYDINAAALTQNYDFIVSTVVLMFLEADTEDYPCQMPFSFTFKEGELAEYYKDWELVKYNENPGHLHRRDENGHRIQLRFATMLAKKK